MESDSEDPRQSFVNEDQDPYELQTDLGAVILSRSFNHSSTWSMGENVIILALYLILEAAHKRWKFADKFQGKEIWVERGEVLKSQSRMIAEIKHLTPKQFRIAFAKLEKFRFFFNITPDAAKRANGYTHLRLCKYEGYQNLNNYKGQTNGKRTANERQRSKNERMKEESSELFPTSSTNNKERASLIPIASARKKRASRIPFESFTEELRVIAEKYGLNGKTEIVFEKFRNYWLAQPGQKGTKLDWVATWRNWCINEKERSYSGGYQKPSAGRIMAEQTEERVAMLRRIFDDDK